LEKELQDLNPDYNIFPLGDSGASFDLGNSINLELNQKVRSMRDWLRKQPLGGIKDIIAGYSSVSLLYDPVFIKKKYALTSTVFEFIKEKLEEAWQSSPAKPTANEGELIRIPVCYDGAFGTDLDHIAQTKGLSKEEIVQYHYERNYYIYMIGFLPGFSYMAEVNKKLLMPRKINPVTVASGSVGIAGSQTGIYPLQCPGGWQIIGRTPIKLFDSEATVPVKLTAGQWVQFYPISKEEYES